MKFITFFVINNDNILVVPKIVYVIYTPLLSDP